MNSDNTMTIEILINEGEPYKFGDINFIWKYRLFIRKVKATIRNKRK